MTEKKKAPRINKKTKIVCTMGPNTDNIEIMRALVENGMDVARFNFSHGFYEEQSARIKLLKKVREEYDLPIAVEVKHGCLDRMALITAIGDRVNRMIPPLIVTKKQIDELIIIMRAAIEDAIKDIA